MKLTEKVVYSETRWSVQNLPFDPFRPPSDFWPLTSDSDLCPLRFPLLCIACAATARVLAPESWMNYVEWITVSNLDWYLNFGRQQAFGIGRIASNPCHGPEGY